MSNSHLLNKKQIAKVLAPYRKKADQYMTRVLLVHAGIALFLAFFYNTWFLGIAVSVLATAAWFGTKALLPESSTHRYLASSLLGIYVALFIYQMHGMFEMHFFAFISAAILIIYQDWKVQIPLIVFIVVHHASFAYAQFAGVPDVYFTQLQYMDLQTFVFHAVLAVAVVAICGKWGHSFRENTINDAITKLQLRASNKKMADINKALHSVKQQLVKKNEELNINNEELNQRNDELIKTTQKQIEINAKLTDIDWKLF
ncbi:hypothetical protein N6H18_12820 [Reichenbachiella agarivorans]|uniref:Methyl-accepting chemotaxis protein n=1 Tax=Reichenbachiella agarivorans TaxID=2979464 RepID=A0ABY6CL36_9BACT|nr:hypothetical protein [Reichenbachiella agarivorans]UXP31231.1 hypothetical protein N6H18_12820 [Reichenbachiella agarivorans]